MTAVAYLKWTILLSAVIALAVILFTYAKGLKKSPRDMWLLFLYKVLEYSAYGAVNPALVLWLGKDCGMGDIPAGWMVAQWSVILSVIGMCAGALTDTLGIRRTMLVSVVFLIISRIFMSFVTNPTLAFITGLLPFAVGIAIVGPLVSVAIKRFTTKESAAMGFGIFYVLMNVGYAIGAWVFDWARDHHALKDAAGKVLDENAGLVLLGHHFSTYQMIFLYGLIAAVGSVVIAFLIRDGVELTDDGTIVMHPVERRGSPLAAAAGAMKDTGKLIANTATEKFFWIYMGLLGITLFVRFVFYHFHYTFPTYGTRVLGEGAKTGSIYGVLNPVLIIFLVPLISWLTRKAGSYQVMIWGTIVSSVSCFIALIPGEWFHGLTQTPLGGLVFIEWLGLAPDFATLAAYPPHDAYWPLIGMIFFFTIGEAIWSPRLMQFTAEIAPKGKEGTYIALSVLPYFLAKFAVGPLSGWLLQTYTPLGEDKKALAVYPEHHMIWLWIGGMAVFTPVGLLVFRKAFLKHAVERAEETP